MLDWSAQPAFPDQLLLLASPVDCRRSMDPSWMSRGYVAPAEARLERFGPTVKSLPAIWNQLASWWLDHRAGANTP